MAGNGFVGGSAKIGVIPGTMVATAGRAAGSFASEEGEEQGGAGLDGAGCAGSAIVDTELQFTL